MRILMLDQLLADVSGLPLWQAGAAGAGAAGVLVVVGLVRAGVHRRLVRRLVRPVAGLVLLLSAEGFYELLAGPVELPRAVAVVWAGVIELSVIAMAQLAERAMAAGRWGYAVGVIVTIYTLMMSAGIMAASAAGSTTAGGVRLLMPLLGATLWLVDALYAHVRPSGGRLSWLWSPRRLMVAIGAMAPDGDDLAAVAHARRQRVAARVERRRDRDARRLARLARRARRGSRVMRASRVARLELLLDDAPASAIDAAEMQVARARAARGRLLGDPEPARAESAQDDSEGVRTHSAHSDDPPARTVRTVRADLRAVPAQTRARECAEPDCATCALVRARIDEGCAPTERAVADGMEIGPTATRPHLRRIKRERAHALGEEVMA